MSTSVGFEGLPGSGKDTLAAALMALCAERNRRGHIVNVEATPDTMTLHTLARQFDLDDTVRTILFWTTRLLQARHVTSLILTKRYELVFEIRTWSSAVVNDQYGSGVPPLVLDWAAGNAQVHPDITLFLDVPIEVALLRKPDSATLQDPARAKRIYDGYQELATRFGWTRIDGTQPLEQVISESSNAIGL